MSRHRLRVKIPFSVTRGKRRVRQSRAEPLPQTVLSYSGRDTPWSQVVHDYGDICQAIAELAQEMNASVTIAEFLTFDRLLDNSIANAVSVYGRHQHSLDFGEKALRPLRDRADEQGMLLDIALRALDALKVGNIGLMGATGAVLEDSLLKLRDLKDRSRPQIRAQHPEWSRHPPHKRPRVAARYVRKHTQITGTFRTVHPSNVTLMP